MRREISVPLCNSYWKLCPSSYRWAGAGHRVTLHPFAQALLRKHRFPLLCFLPATCPPLKSVSSAHTGSFCLLFQKVFMGLESFHLRQIDKRNKKKNSNYLVCRVHSVLGTIMGFADSMKYRNKSWRFSSQCSVGLGR